jgi:hypothetical protein
VATAVAYQGIDRTLVRAHGLKFEVKGTVIV